jgi:serine/threonine-protein kinase
MQPARVRKGIERQQWRRRGQSRALLRLRHQVEERDRELLRLNEELRRQIHDRSARLAEAFGRIGRLLGHKNKALPIGTIVGERYKILGGLGQGGMSVVYEVERTSDGRRFALKTLAQPHSGRCLARLAREVQAATAVVHPNVVGMIDIDIDAAGIPFLVMELVKGEPLSAQPSRFGDPHFASEVVCQVAAGLSALHQAGVVHRDLKPSNVLVERAQGDTFCAKIVDFGIARVSPSRCANLLQLAPRELFETDEFIAFVAGDTSRETIAEVEHIAPLSRVEEDGFANAALTRTGGILGTPMYMAPELASGAKDAAPSCDMWSLGVVAYQLGCGRLPFQEPPLSWTIGELWRPPPVDTRRLSEPLRGVVERCLDIDPARRPSAVEVAETLRSRLILSEPVGRRLRDRGCVQQVEGLQWHHDKDVVAAQPDSAHDEQVTPPNSPSLSGVRG